MQNYTAASVTAPDMVGNQAVLLRVLCWMVMNASWKAMIRGNDGEKIRKQGLIQVISIAQENCGPEKQHSFSKVIG